jgi:mannan endo-1,4-beta-mannosidase
MLASALSVVGAAPASAATGLHVEGGEVVERNGRDFVMRGVNVPHAWFPSRTPQALTDVKALGANTVRVVLSGGRWTANGAGEVAEVISLCKRHRLICVLENHDTTGWGEARGAYTMSQAVDYWIGLRSVLIGQEDYVVLNIGNEPLGSWTAFLWKDWTTAAIQRMRGAGLHHMIMADAPAWGQDSWNTMRDNASSVLRADPDRNTLFSVHMYGVYNTFSKITSYLDAFQRSKLPLVIGEFGDRHSDGDPDENAILSQAGARDIGYLGWSWSGNGGGVEYLDMVTDFDVRRLTSWGRRIFHGPDGIAATSREASAFGPAD